MVISLTLGVADVDHSLKTLAKGLADMDIQGWELDANGCEQSMYAIRKVLPLYMDKEVLGSWMLGQRKVLATMRFIRMTTRVIVLLVLLALASVWLGRLHHDGT
jgi:hypothetical protein